jgi:hypothetical protein
MAGDQFRSERSERSEQPSKSAPLVGTLFVVGALLLSRGLLEWVFEDATSLTYGSAMFGYAAFALAAIVFLYLGRWRSAVRCGPPGPRARPICSWPASRSASGSPAS